MSSVRSNVETTVAGRDAEQDLQRGERHTEQPSERRTGSETSDPSGRTVVVGGGQLGQLVAQQLVEGGTDAVRSVHYVDDDDRAISRAARHHEATLVGDLTSKHALEPIDDGTTAVVVATPSDASTLLVVGHLKASFEVPRIVAVVRDARNRDVYPPDVECVCATTLLAAAIVETVR